MLRREARAHRLRQRAQSPGGINVRTDHSPANGQLEPRLGIDDATDPGDWKVVGHAAHAGARAYGRSRMIDSVSVVVLVFAILLCLINALSGRSPEW